MSEAESSAGIVVVSYNEGEQMANKLFTYRCPDKHETVVKAGNTDESTSTIRPAGKGAGSGLPNPYCDQCGEKTKIWNVKRK